MPNRIAHKPVALQVKVTLLDVEPPIWRRVLLLDSTSLRKLHHIIQALMGWQNYHLHAFEIDGVRYGPTELGLDDSTMISEWGLTLWGFRQAKADIFRYEYDFGDDWWCAIEIEGELPTKRGARYPICLEGERAGPPEDSGGPPGYEDKLAILQDPTHEEYEDLVE
ncbi:MAG: plasmid pRiA4b ORF-3 family protein [Dehalococcoidia bacterium]